VAKIHPGKQDFNTLQTRKMKGLKRSRDDDVEADAPMADADEDKVDDDALKQALLKKARNQ
jgi:ribosome production factor 2